MKVCFYLNSLSPHQRPLFNELASHFPFGECIYIAVDHLGEERQSCGWTEDTADSAPILFGARCDSSKINAIVSECSLLICNIRDLDLFMYRAEHNRKTIYFSERWFKPLFGRLPGWFRLFVPHYFLMARSFFKMMAKGYLKYYGAGVYAVRDMQLVSRCFGCNKAMSPDVIKLWGYFVGCQKSVSCNSNQCANKRLSVLYIGRLLRLKHVDVAIKAIKACRKMAISEGRIPPQLDIYGMGKDRKRLERIAHGYNDVIRFFPPVPMGDVRQIMRSHDVLVFLSDAREGWGVVVNEALEEGLRVIGSLESGACATMLSKEWLLSCRDERTLVELLMQCSREKAKCGRILGQGIGNWNVKNAAARLLSELYYSCQREDS